MLSRFVAVIAIVLAFPLCSRADNVLVGTGPGQFSGGDCPCGWVVDANINYPTVVAAQFSLYGTSFVSTIDATLESFSGDQLTLSLVSSLTGTGTTFGSQTFTSPGLDTELNQSESFTFDLSLAPGTYYLLLSTTAGLGDEWMGSDNTLIQNAGAVSDGMWVSEDGGTTWSFDGISNPICPFGCQPAVFAVNGTSTPAAPEPSTFALLALAILVFIGAARLRRQRHLAG
jgi:hypothetical protein